MSRTCPTVRVVADNEDGYTVINESDLTESHELYVPKPAPAVEAPKPPQRGKK